MAVCVCEPWNCANLILTQADIQVLELDWARLGRALCKAFGLVARPAGLGFGLRNTRQIGSWSIAAVPVLLTIQRDPREFRAIVAELAARLREKFILLAPTSDNLDAASQELLAHAGAGFFSLEGCLTFTPHGNFEPRKTPGELFARFLPEVPEPVPEDVARQAFALVKQLETEQANSRKAPVYTIFRLYCVEALGPIQIARRIGCARSLVFNRLELLRQKLGRDPAELRQYSAHFASIEESLSDARASRVHRAGAIYGREEERE